MIGAIIGDVVGSVYEFNNHRSKEFYDRAGLAKHPDALGVCGQTARGI
jgi:hypothetical protein